MNTPKLPPQAPTLAKLPPRLSGESERDYERRIAAFLRGDDVRTKTDLVDWTGCPPFHLDHS